MGNPKEKFPSGEVSQELELVQRFEEKAGALAEELQAVRHEGQLLYEQLSDKIRANALRLRADSAETEVDTETITAENQKLIQLQDRITEKMRDLNKP